MNNSKTSKNAPIQQQQQQQQPHLSTSSNNSTITPASKQTKISKLVSVGGRRKMMVTGNSTPLHLKKDLLDVSSPVIIKSLLNEKIARTTPFPPTKRSLNPILIDAKNSALLNNPSEILVYEDDNNPFLDYAPVSSNISNEISKNEEEIPQTQTPTSRNVLPTSSMDVLPTPSNDVILLKPLIKEKIPAFQRFASLTKKDDFFKLPKKFLHLENLLSIMDRLISLKSGRSEPFIFLKNISSLESAIGRRVEWVQLRMLFTLYKDGCGEDLYKRENMTIIDNGKKVLTVSLSIQGAPESFKGSEHDYLAYRRSVIIDSLTLLMSKRHEEFLKSINFTLPEGAQLKAWHPKFDYESNDSYVGIDLFEIIPSDKVELLLESNLTSAAAAALPSKETLNAINSIIPNKEILSNLTNEKKEPVTSITIVVGSASVLDRIRKKQKDAELLRMGALQNGESKEFLAEKYKLQNMIPLLDKIAMIFASSKKTSLLLSEVKTRLMDSSNGLSSGLEIIEQIDGLIKIIRPSNYLKSISAGSSKDGDHNDGVIIDDSNSMSSMMGPLTLRIGKGIPLQEAKNCIYLAISKHENSKNK